MDARPALHPYIVAGSCFLGMREARPAGKLGPVTISSLVLVSEALKLEPTSILLDITWLFLKDILYLGCALYNLVLSSLDKLSN